MKVLALDLSTSTGWALLEGEPICVKPKLLEYGVIKGKGPARIDYPYPWNYFDSAVDISSDIYQLVFSHMPNVVVIEETNLSRGSRYSQKILEFIHYAVLDELRYLENTTRDDRVDVKYIDSATWRKTLNLRLTPADKINNKKIKQAKAKAKRRWSASLAQIKKGMGIKGAITKKHLAIRHVNGVYDLDLRMKDNDAADTICQGMAFFLNPKFCTG